MTRIKVDQVTRNQAPEQAVIEEQKRRIQLFGHSALEATRATFADIGKQDFSALTQGAKDRQKRGRAQDEAEQETIFVKSREGTRIELPCLSSEQYEQIDAILSQSTPEQAEHLIRSSRVVSAAAYDELRDGRTVAPFGLEATSAGQTAYETYLLTTKHRADEKATEDTLLFGMYGAEQNLRDYFGGVKEEQQVAADLRTDVAELDELLADWPEGQETEVIDYREVVFNDDGSISVVEHKGVEVTKAEAEALRDRLKGSIESLGQFENRQMTQLQWMVNRYQQAMTTLSNILKNTHDTHKAIIANTKA